jgi:23S rRNA pseudouridine1911/1915/1917 synthase
MAVTRQNSREAVTHWQVLCRYGPFTHVQCRLETGRTHQIRVHMAHIGRPIVGDPLYNGKKGELGFQTQCLHARQLTFIHPRTGETMSLSCPLPEEFQNALRKLEDLL